MNKKIYRLDWDTWVIGKITDDLRCRKLSQQYIYFWKWSENYCDYVNDSFLTWWNASSNSMSLNPWKDILLKQKKNISNNRQVYIWVACWDSTREIEFIRTLDNNILYIGVDLSSEMIDLSENNLKWEAFDWVLIQSNIFNPELLNLINSFLDESDEKSFIFLWATFGNFMTTNITDLIGSYMKTWERLYIDIPVKWPLWKDDFNLHDYYLKKLKSSSEWAKYILSGFHYINFPIEKWDIVIHTHKDSEVWLFWVHHSLRLKENIEFLLSERVVIFSKNEEIKFFSVTYYEIKKLVNFMKLHHFNLLEEDLDAWILWQFLFEKE